MITRYWAQSERQQVTTLGLLELVKINDLLPLAPPPCRVLLSVSCCCVGLVFIMFAPCLPGGLILKYVPFLTPTRLLMNLHRGTVTLS